MDNNYFMFQLNSTLAERDRILKLSKVDLTKDDKVIITFIVRANDYDNRLEEVKPKVKEFIDSIIPKSFNTAIVYKKTETTENHILSLIMSYLYEESPLLYPKVNGQPIKIEIGFTRVDIDIGLPSDVYSYMINNEFDSKIASYLEKQIMEEVSVAFYIDSNAPKKTIKHRKTTFKDSVGVKTISVNITENVVGMIAKMPIYIADAMKKECESQTICGKVSDVQERTSKAGKTFYTFKIDDTTAQTECVFFSKFDKQLSAFHDLIKDGKYVVVEGRVQMSQFTGSFNMMMRKIALCDVDFSTINNDVVYNDVPDEYFKITPETYKNEKQSSIFDIEKPEIPDTLKGTFVVFDLETTGTNPTEDRIVEIGAVKMVDGVITETFSTLINPEIPIPEDASRVNGIYDKDVANAPVLEDVIGDFYKFCYKLPLVGHNVSFDVGFISFWGKKLLYDFDNDNICTLKMAKQIFKRNNHNTLGDLCKQLDIDLTNAHRALFDTIATAELYKKLCLIESKNS